MMPNITSAQTTHRAYVAYAFPDITGADNVGAEGQKYIARPSRLFLPHVDLVHTESRELSHYWAFA